LKMQISVTKRQYMSVLLNIRSNIYQENRDQLKRDLLTMRKLLTLIDEPSENMVRVEQALSKRLVKKF
jgi:hypothetical protein